MPTGPLRDFFVNLLDSTGAEITSANPLPVTIGGGGGGGTVQGSKTNNAAVPGTSNIGTLPGVATVAAPTYTEGFQVAASLDLLGNLRVTLGTLISGEDQANNLIRIMPGGAITPLTHAPAVSTRATITQAAGSGTVRNVCTGVSFGFAALTAPIATQLTVNLRDGATGVGTILQSWTVVIPAAIGNFNISMPSLNIVGSQATAMTLEWSALLTSAVQYVNMQLAQVAL